MKKVSKNNVEIKYKFSHGGGIIKDNGFYLIPILVEDCERTGRIINAAFSWSS